MEQLVEAIVNSITLAGLVQVEVSARHVHLSQKDLEVLFGTNVALTPKRELSQWGQFLAEERVNLIGPKTRRNNVAVLGPVRKETQVELSKSDCMELGVSAPIRESGDVKGSGKIIIEGTCGSLEIEQGVIIAHSHIHVPCKIAREIGLKDKERVNVHVFSERPVVFRDVIIRVSDNFRFRMHIDFDEANAAGVSGFVFGKIIKNTDIK
jgi:putative phosphotransacetylase